MALNNDQMTTAAARLVESAKSLKHPLLPVNVRESIYLAALLIETLVKREVGRGD